MIDALLRDLWTPTGLILGFQITFFKWRLEEEAAVGDKGSIPWLVPSDYANIVAMLTFVVGVVLLPVLGLATTQMARAAFGIGVLLFVGQALGLAGHYQLYNRTKKREFVWFPMQERIVMGLTAAAGITYFVLLLRL
jgi:hypothetical protein